MDAECSDQTSRDLKDVIDSFKTCQMCFYYLGVVRSSGLTLFITLTLCIKFP